MKKIMILTQAVWGAVWEWSCFSWVVSGVEAMADKICRPEGQVLHLWCDHAHVGGSGRVGWYLTLKSRAMAAGTQHAVRDSGIGATDQKRGHHLCWLILATAEKCSLAPPCCQLCIVDLFFLLVFTTWVYPKWSFSGCWSEELVMFFWFILSHEFEIAWVFVNKF